MYTTLYLRVRVWCVGLCVGVGVGGCTGGDGAFGRSGALGAESAVEIPQSQHELPSVTF